jgi:glucan phosphoethanolaminetransferase (alkaline phosphatase superfamily)
MDTIVKFIRKAFWPYLIISVLTILVLLPDMAFFLRNKVYNYAFSGFFIVQCLLLMPVVLFCRRLKIYYTLLAFIVALAPLMFLPVFYMNIQVNAEIVGIVMDSNKKEMIELVGWNAILLLIAMILLGWLFYKLAAKLPSQISWKQGLLVSVTGLLLFGVLPFFKSNKLVNYFIITRNISRTYYPFRLANVYTEIKSEMGNMELYKLSTKNFKFNAVKKDTARQIHLLIIGEAARYDHWGLNRYARNTSPQLQTLQNFFSFSNVSSGASMTILSVPQLITRAEPATYERHKKEKSVLTAFKEAGYFTCWLSNQSRYGLTGNIGMHFNDGDTAVFCGHGENETNFTGNYDEEILTKMKELLNANKDCDIFMVVHLIGSHWRYVLRYPPSFEKFTPVSNRNRMLLNRPTKEIMINEYDNSILYTDYILKSISKLIDQENTNASFLFVSDHGENFNDNNDGLYFHSYIPAYCTIKIPLFVWFNQQYASAYPGVINNVRINSSQKISSAETVFYTLTDIGRLSYKGFDSTKNLAGSYLLPSRQPVLGELGKLYYFDQLK